MGAATEGAVAIARTQGAAFVALVAVLVWEACASYPAPPSPTIPPSPPPLIGEILFYSVGEDGYELHVMNADGSGTRPATGVPYEEAQRPYYPARVRIWSPDRSRYAYIDWTTHSDPDISGGYITGYSNVGLYVVEAAGARPTLLSRDVDLWECAPSWSPDGTYLTLSHSGDIWVLRADGGGRTNLTGSAARDSCPSWLAGP